MHLDKPVEKVGWTTLAHQTERTKLDWAPISIPMHTWNIDIFGARANASRQGGGMTRWRFRGIFNMISITGRRWAVLIFHWFLINYALHLRASPHDHRSFRLILKLSCDLVHTDSQLNECTHAKIHQIRLFSGFLLAIYLHGSWLSISIKYHYDYSLSEAYIEKRIGTISLSSGRTRIRTRSDRTRTPERRCVCFCAAYSNTGGFSRSAK